MYKKVCRHLHLAEVRSQHLRSSLAVVTENVFYDEGAWLLVVQASLSIIGARYAP